MEVKIFFKEIKVLNYLDLIHYTLVIIPLMRTKMRTETKIFSDLG